MITVELLDNEIAGLREQHRQALNIAHQAVGAIQLAEALKEKLLSFNENETVLPEDGS